MSSNKALRAKVDNALREYNAATVAYHNAERRYQAAQDAYRTDRPVHWSEAAGTVMLIMVSVLGLAELFFGAQFGPFFLLLQSVRYAKACLSWD